MNDSIVKPKVSVCTPVYNGSDYIAESIESILSQTYKDFNLIVCDNCSTDDTEKIVRSFKDPRLIYKRNTENLGLVGNANRCIELADGEYVYIIHHDDIMLPENLEHKVRILDKNPHVGLVHSGVLMIDQEGKPLDIQWFSEAKRDYIEDGIEVFKRYVMNLPVGAAFFIGSILARRDCYLNLGGFNPKLLNANDSEMWMRILLFYDVACISRPLVKYRLHDNTTSASTLLNDGHGISLRGLEEHSLTAKIVIDKYKNRIPQWKKLKNRVSTAFAIMAVRKGFWLFIRRKFSLSMDSFKTALKFCPLILFKKAFWILIKALMIKQIKEVFKSNSKSIDSFE